MIIKPKTIKALKTEELSVADFAAEIAANVPAVEIAKCLGEFIKQNDVMPSLPKVPITKEMFEAHFRVIGYTVDGTPSTRGRKKKEA